jgi:flagellar biosynthesis/type III secretory pathway M-ring protein FliF/YscJ
MPFHYYILNLFLYFPEDKREYIPAAITCTLFLIAAVLTMRLIIKISKRQEEKAKQFEEQLRKENIIRDEN